MRRDTSLVEGRTLGDAPLIDRPLIEIAAKIGELPAEKIPALVAKMTGLVVWHAQLPTTFRRLTCILRCTLAPMRSLKRSCARIC